VAIVGRPNVGKSTLFNRYAGHRRALVADVAGLTRDRIAEEVEVAGRRVRVVDTAGLDPDAEKGLGAAVQAQARSAVAEADAVLFVVDGKAGLLPEDEAIARTLRKTDKPLAVAVNKIDVPEHRERVHEFHALGLDPVVAMSAEHGHGAFDALEQLVEALPAAAPEGPAEAEDALRIAIVGRPNAGKSSLLNRLAGQDRVVVSEVPGTTRDSVDIRIERTGEGGEPNQPLILVDTAGLRRAAKRAERLERGSALMTVRSLERAEAALILIDATEGVGDQDARILNLVADSGCAAVVVINKWDLIGSPEEGEQVRSQLERALRFATHYPVVALSARTGARLPRLWPAVERVHEAAGRRIPTGELNRWLEETVTRHEPSMARRGSRRRPIRFFYAAQTGVHPPTFVLFCTEPGSVLPSYRRYLENRLRERFDFAGTPVRLQLRARRSR